jgi:formate hydrogenlyase subunit 3/multisubunit Na+/H+ antiporter MnhD subunit
VNEGTEMYNCVSHEELIKYSENQEIDVYKKQQKIIICAILALYALCIIFKVYHDYIVKSLKNELEFNRIQNEMLNDAINKLLHQNDHDYTFKSQDAIIDMKGCEENDEDDSQ